ADGVDPLIDVRDEVEGEQPAGRVVVRAEVARRLVDDPVDRPLVPDWVVVHGDGLGFRVNAQAQVGDAAAVDLDPAAGDQPVAVPARPDPGVGQEFVQAFHTEDSTTAGRRNPPSSTGGAVSGSFGARG